VTELWTAGVCAERFTRSGPGFRAVIELDAPRRDLSQMQIIRDDVVEHALTAVEQVHRDALAQLEASSPTQGDGVLERQVRELPRKHAASEPLSAMALFSVRGLHDEGWKTFRIFVAILALGMGSILACFALLMWLEGRGSSAMPCCAGRSAAGR